MHISGIIAEYDPFHNGHAYHIAKTKSGGADAVVVAIGGEFTQRGSPAWCSKYLRAECAMLGGADLVVEIPLPYAVGSAERFAEGGVKVLNALGCVDTLSFGSESGNAKDIWKYAVMSDSDEYLEIVKKEMKSGISCPVARKTAAERLAPETAYISDNPNDALASEYVKWIIREKSKMNISPVIRYGTVHGENSYKSGIASASYLRSFENPEDFRGFVPPYAQKLMEEEYEAGNLPSVYRNYEIAAMSVLRTKTPEDIRKVPGAGGEGLYNRVYRAVMNSCSLKDITEQIKTKRYTMTRVDRIIAGAVLGLDEEKIRWAGIPYVRVLAMNEKGKEILKMSSETSSVPVDTSLKKLSETSDKAYYIAEKESLAEDLWQICLNNPGKCGLAYTFKTIVK